MSLLPAGFARHATGLLTRALLTQRSANGCYKEAADIAGTLGQYPRAIELFERVASQSLGSALTRYGVKEYYLKAGLCWLATGVSRPFQSSHPVRLTDGNAVAAVPTGRRLDQAGDRQLLQRRPVLRHAARVQIPERYRRRFRCRRRRRVHCSRGRVRPVRCFFFFFPSRRETTYPFPER